MFSLIVNAVHRSKLYIQSTYSLYKEVTDERNGAVYFKSVSAVDFPIGSIRNKLKRERGCIVRFWHFILYCFLLSR